MFMYQSKNSCTRLKPFMDMARGGIHQRLATAAQQEESNSAVAEYLLNEFAWGRMSPQQMQSIAALAMQDVEKAVEGKLLRDLRFLSKIGNEGRHPNNMYRDVMRMVDSRYNLCPMTTLEIPSKMGETMANLLMPHELFAFMHAKHPDQFHKAFLPRGQEDLQRFWQQCKYTPALKDQSFSKNPAKCIPIAIHGDEVPVAGRGKCYCKFSIVWSWFGLAASMLPTRESLMLIWCCNPQQFEAGELGTLDCFWKAVAWSMTILFTGRWPHRDWRGVNYAVGTKEYKRAGEFLANGYHCQLLSLCGDLDYTNKYLGTPHWGSTKRPCNLCLAESQGARTWKDFRDSAPWRETILTASQWRIHADNRNCAIFTVPNVSGLSVQPDLMHAKYLGYVQFFLGSVLFLLTHHILPASPLANLRRIGLIARRILRRTNKSAPFNLSQWSKLSIFLRQKGFPKMRGKGAQIRALAPVLGIIWNRFCSSDNINHRRISLIFKLDAEIEQILDNHKPVNGYYTLGAQLGAVVRQKQIQLSQLYIMLEESYAEEPTTLVQCSLQVALHSTHHGYRSGPASTSQLVLEGRGFHARHVSPDVFLFEREARR